MWVDKTGLHQHQTAWHMGASRTAPHQRSALQCSPARQARTKTAQAIRSVGHHSWMNSAPAFTAFAGPNTTPCSSKKRTAQGVHGMLAPAQQRKKESGLRRPDV